MQEDRLQRIPALEHFAQVADPSRYVRLPDDWRIGLSDVVDSTGAIAAGRYKAVNLAGAASVSAVSNALGGDFRLFVYGGDGARFAIPPAQAEAAADALSRVARWAAQDLDLTLRVGMTTVAAVRAAGLDARVAFWRASDHVSYAMFTGGGLAWAEGQLKSGAIGLPPAPAGHAPDLTGLSCQWGPIVSRRGEIVSLIVEPAAGASQGDFAAITSDIVEALAEAAALNPVPGAGPPLRWPAGAIDLQSRVAAAKSAGWRRLRVITAAALAWLVFRLGIRIGGFDPGRYRREIAANTDFRKFDDALMMTIDAPPDLTARLRTMLDAAAGSGIVRYGLHTQQQALMTCVVPSVLAPDHMHFVDGASGGYAMAARNLRAAGTPG